MRKYLAGMRKIPGQPLVKIQKGRLIEWRRENTLVKIAKPTRIDRARRLGYMAKGGFVVVRVRVKKGMRKRPKPSGGRVPKKAGRFFPLGKSKQQVAEERAARKFPNLNVLNSYYAGEDGVSKWFEVILVDTSRPEIRNDRKISWICKGRHRGRAFRGLTSAGKGTKG